jgi:predicted Zn-dependent protease
MLAGCCRSSPQCRVFLGGVQSIVILIFCNCTAFAHPGLDEDIARTTELLAVKPDSIELRVQRANLYWLHGEWNAAEADCKEALKCQPDLPPVELLLAHVHIDSGRTVEARERLDAYINAHPSEPAGWWLRGKAWQKDKCLEEAVADYSKAVDVGSEVPIVYFLDVVTTLLEQGPISAPTAERRTREGLERFKDNEVLLQLLQRSLMSQKRFDEALAALDKRMAGRPRQEWRLAERGGILMEAGRISEALTAFEEADRLVKALPSRVRYTRAVEELSATISGGIERLAAQGRSARVE